MARDRIRFLRNGKAVEVQEFAPRTTLLDYLRLQERSVGTKEGCAEGDCGACTVVLGRVKHGRIVYEPVNSCIVLLGQADGAEIVTVEDLADETGLHPVQTAMVEHHGSQCGFCTPGIVMSLFALYHEAPRPVSRETINDALAGNLCRCTGYRPIVDAALSVCAAPAADKFAGARRSVTAGRLLDREQRSDQDVFVGDDAHFFAAPGSIETLADLYLRHPDATLVAGATDVGLTITKGLQDIRKIIWLGRVEDFDTMIDTEQRLTIGAGATHASAQPYLAAIDPDLGEIVRRFGSLQVRVAGTVGGNIANGSPIGDLAPALIALAGEVELQRGRTETRTLPLERFFIGYGRQDRREGEFVRRLTVPKLKPDEAFRCYKVSKRFDEDISAVMGAYKFTVDGRRIAHARIAYGGMAATPKRADAAEAALVGSSLDDPDSWHAALAALSRDYTPMTDQRASAEYRAAVARNLLLKALSEVASGDTRATRIVGCREALEAAE